MTDLLVHGRLKDDAIDTIVEAGLAGYATERSARGAPDGATEEALNDPRLRQARLLLAARHASARRAVADLLKVWGSAKVEALLFKGFYLSEFVYPNATIRLYSDVDLALRSTGGLDQRQLAAKAARLAREHGWRVDWYFGEPDSVTGHHDVAYDGHELLLLHHEASGISLDAHRRLIHKNDNRGRRRDVGERITEAVWAGSQTVELGGAEVRVPRPVDAALVGLIATRSWSSDRYRLRPHDLLDLEALMAKGRFDLSALRQRAAELGLETTTRLFLRRCDPVGRRLDLRPLAPLEVVAYDTLLLSERGHRGAEQLWARIKQLPEQVRAVVAAWPTVAGQVRRKRAGQPLHQEPRLEVARAARAPTRPLDRRSWMGLQFGVRRALQLHAMKPEDDRELALACLLSSARRHGYAVEYDGESGELYYGSGTRVPGGASGASGASGAGGAGDSDGRVLLPTTRLVEVDEASKRGGPGATPDSTVPRSGGRAAAVPIARAARSAGTLLKRASEIGYYGLRLRLEALLLLRRVVRRLEDTPFKSLHAELVAQSDPTGNADSTGSSGSEALAVGRATESAARFVPRAMCVAQSLTAQAMLNRRGVPSVIHFGFKRNAQGAVEGHAWLEANGAVVTGDVGLDDFTRTATFEG